MVAIVSGESLGLSLSSFATLGQQGSGGTAVNGRSGEQAFVNIATGNLVLRSQDEYLAALGEDVGSVRTYNSQGKASGQDSWAVGAMRQAIVLAQGSLGEAGSVLARTDRDGATALYSWNGQRYVTTDGAGADDEIRLDAGAYVWTDAATGAQERYDSGGRLISLTDAEGRTQSFTYDQAGKLSKVTSLAAGESATYNYTDGRLTSITTALQGGATITKVRYSYDPEGRLSRVAIDLTPENQTDNRFYETVYGYDGASERVASIVQSDGTSLAFTYVEQGGVHRLGTVRDGLMRVTSYQYDTAARRTTVIDPTNVATIYQYDVKGQLERVETASAGAVGATLTTTTIEVPVTAIDVDVVTDPQGAKRLQWAQPSTGTHIQWRYRPAGGGEQDWVQLATTQNANGTVGVLLPTSAAGTFEYELLQTAPGSSWPTGRALGSFTVALVAAGHYEVRSVPVQPVSVTIVPGAQAGQSRMEWAAPAQGVTTTWRYRVAGTTGEWTNLTVLSASGKQYVDLGPLPAASYQFDLLQRSADGSPVAHATGTVTVHAEKPAETSTDGSRFPLTPGLNSKGEPVISWPAPTAGTTTTFRYLESGSWKSRSTTIDSASGTQFVNLSGIRPADYAFELKQTGSSTITVTGTMRLQATVPAHTETQNLPVDVIPLSGGSTGISWPASDGGGTFAFNYRVAGSSSWRKAYPSWLVLSNGTWQLPIERVPEKGKWVEFDLTLTAADGRITAHATGLYFRQDNPPFVTVKIGTVGQENGTWTIVGPTATTRPQTVNVPEYTPPPQFVGANTYYYPAYTPLATATTDTPPTRDVSVWVTEKLDVTDVQEGAVSSAPVTVAYYAGSTAAGRHVQTFTYNGRGDVAAVTNGAGETTVFEYDSRGNQTLVRDAAGNTIRRTYTAEDLLETETVYTAADPDGAGPAQATGALTTRYVYDPAHAHRLRFVLTPDRRLTEHRYNALGQRVATLAYGETLLPQASATDHATLASWAGTQRGAGVARTDFTYDHRDLLATATRYDAVDATGTGIVQGQRRTRYVYDAAGRLLDVIDGDQKTTSYRYDGLGRVYELTDALGQVTVTDHDDARNRTVVTLANGLATTSVYDRAGRFVAQVVASPSEANLGTTVYSNDAAGRVIMTTGPTGVRTFCLYDSEGRKVGEVDGDGSLTEYRYDLAGRVTRTIRYSARVAASLLVDAQGRPRNPALATVLASIQPGSADAHSWQAYDAAGRLAKTVDGEGGVTEYFYDGASRLVRVRQYAEAILNPQALGDRPQPADIPPAASSGADRITRHFYSADGLRLATLDAEGFLKENEYDAAGRLVRTIAYAQGTALAQRADGTLDQLRPARDALRDAVTVYLYNGKDELVGEVDAQGYLTEFIYDKAGRRSESIRYARELAYEVAPGSAVRDIRPANHAEDRKTTWVYDAIGRLVQETDHQGTVTTHAYDELGNRTASTVGSGLADSRTLAFRFDLQGRLTGELNANGYAELAAELALPSRSQSAIDAIWAAWGVRHSYNEAGWRTSTTDQNGHRTLYFHDADGRLTHTINALGEVRETRYDGLGRPESERHYAARLSAATLPGLQGGTVTDQLASALLALRQNAKDRVVDYRYDRRGLLVSHTDGERAVTEIGRDAFGQETTRIAAKGTAAAVVTRTEYDRRGLATLTLRDEGGLAATTRVEHDAFGRIRYSWDARNNPPREFQYDRLGRTVTVVDAAGESRMTSYDAFGRVLTQTNELKETTRYEYDAATRQLRVVTPENVSVVTRYNRFGQAFEVQDGRNVVTQYQYDANGALVAKRVAGALQESNEYDKAGRLWKHIDANNVVVEFKYDAAGRTFRRIVDPAGLNLVTEYTYDEPGLRHTTRDPNGAVTEFIYDRNGRLKTQTVDKGGLNLVTAYDYDERGNTLTVTSAGGTVTNYVYDKLDRRISETVDPAGLKITRTYEYDENGNVRKAIDANGGATRYVYDSRDRLVFTVEDAGKGGVANTVKRVRFTDYDAAGRVTKTVAFANFVSLAIDVPTIWNVIDALGAAGAAGADVVENRVYDHDGRLTAIVNGLGEVLRFRYDANGNVIERRAFVNRLPNWQPGSDPVPTAHESDEWQRTAYDAQNRAIYTVGADGSVVTRAYDANGNLVQQRGYAARLANPGAFDGSSLLIPQESASDLRLRNAYDAANRLVRQVDGAGSVRAFAYDANGNVVESVRYAEALSGTALASALSHGQALPLPTAAPGRDAYVRTVYDAANRAVATATAQRHDASRGLLWSIQKLVLDGNGNIVSRTDHAALMSSSGLPATPSQAQVAVWISVVASDPAQDRQTRMAYDKANRLRFQADAMNGVTQWAYDAAGNVVKRTAHYTPLNLSGAFTETAVATALGAGTVNDRVTRTVFDAAQRAVYEVDGVGAVTQHTYDGTGRVVATRRYAMPVSIATTAATPDLIGMEERVVSNAAIDRVSYSVFDGGGHQVYSVDALGFVRESVRDGVGRVTATVQYATAISTSTAKAVASIKQAVAHHPEDRKQEFQYDAAGRLQRNVDALGNPESYTYDGLGRKESFTNKAGATWNYEYDAAGRLTRELSPWVNVMTVSVVAGSPVVTGSDQRIVTVLTYDALGNLQSRTEAAGTDKERTTSYLYDAAGRQVKTTFPQVKVYDPSAAAGADGRTEVTKAPTVTVTYNAFGEAVVNQDIAGNYSQRVMDQAGRVEYEVDAGRYVTRYKRNVFGEVTETTRYAQTTNAAPDAVLTTVAAAGSAADRVLTTEYDAVGRVTKVIEPQVYMFDQSHRADGFTASKYTANTYNVFGELLRQTVGTGDTNVASDNFYSYDKLGRRVEAIAVAERLSTSSGSGFVTTMSYDAVGNMTERVEFARVLSMRSTMWDPATGTTATVPAAHEDDRRTRYAYDANNNLLTETRLGAPGSIVSDGTQGKADAVTRYGYDAVGNQVFKADPLGNVVYTYRDALGRVRAEATVSQAKRRAQIAQLYLAILRRSPEAEGLQYWAERNETIEEVATALYLSAEGAEKRSTGADPRWATDPTGALIDQVYKQLVARNPDSGAPSWWRSTMSGDNDAARIKLVTDMIAGFSQDVSADSAVMNTVTGVALQEGSDSQLQAARWRALRGVEIAQLYAAVFGRAGDPSGMEFYTSGPLTIPAIVSAFLASPEGKALYNVADSVDLVSRIYQNIYSRNALPEGASEPLLDWLELYDSYSKDGQPHACGRLVEKMIQDVQKESSRSLDRFNARVGAALAEAVDPNLGPTQLTKYFLDAHGNVAARRELAAGALHATATTYRSYDSGQDRLTYFVHDAAGRLTQTLDAHNNLLFASHDAFGRVAKEWRSVTGADGSVRTWTQVREYDALGQLKQLTEPGAVQSMSFNAFGELTGRKVSATAGGEVLRDEYYDYDNAGRVWRTNAGDNVHKVMLHDAAGRTTAEIRSATKNLKTDAAVTDASQVVTAAGIVRTNTRYNLLGHALQVTQPSQTAGDIGNGGQPLMTSNSVWLQFLQEGAVTKLKWSSLAGLGSGDVKVEVRYTFGEGDHEFPNSWSRVVRADEALEEMTLQGVDYDNVLSYTVQKKDVAGEWRTVINGTGTGQQGVQWRILAPAELTTSVQLKYRAQGATTWSIVPPEQMPRFGDAIIFDATYLLDAMKLAEGRFDYQVETKVAGGVWTVRNEGSASVVSPLLRNQLARLYVGVLQRAPDLGGMGFWSRELQTGSTMEQIAYKFYNSKESDDLYGAISTRNHRQVVATIYRTVLGREDVTETGGVLSDPVAESWAAALTGAPQADRGKVLLDMLSSIANYAGNELVLARARDRLANRVAVGLAYAVDYTGYTATEAKDVVSGVDHTAVKRDQQLIAARDAQHRRDAARLYVSILNRAPEADGLTYYVNSLKGGQSLAQIAQNMYASLEAKAARNYWKGDGTAVSDTEFVTKFYQMVLNRSVPSADLSKWTSRLAGNTALRGQVMVEMIGSVVDYAGTDATVLTGQRLLNNKAAIALAYAFDSAGSNPAAAAGLIAHATADEKAVQAAKDAVAAYTAAQANAQQALSATQAAANATPMELTRTLIAQLYVALLDRAPDRDGITTRASQSLSTGAGYVSLESHAYQLYTSSEGQAIFRGTSNAAFVSRVFNNAFGRAPTSEEAKPFQELLDTNKKTRHGVVSDIISSVVGYGGWDPAILDLQKVFHNRVAVGLAYGLYMGGGGSVSFAQSLMNQVTSPVDTTAALNAAATRITDDALAPYLATASATQAALAKANENKTTAQSAYSETLAAETAAANANSKPVTDASTRYTNIAHLYLGALNRNSTNYPKWDELDYWFRVGGTIVEIAYSFLMSDEGKTVYQASMTNSEFVSKVYTVALNRSVDSDGLAYWTNHLNAGMTRQQALVSIIDGFLGYTGTSTSELGYIAAFRQEISTTLSNAKAGATAAGKTSVATELGTAHVKVDAQRVATLEKIDAINAANVAITSATGEAGYYMQVTQLYLSALNRAGNLAEHQERVAELKAGKSLDQMANEFLSSPEGKTIYATTLSNEGFVNKVFEIVFKRAADADGKAYWMNKLASGQSRAQVLNGMTAGLLNYTGLMSSEHLCKKNFIDRMSSSLAAVNTSAQAAVPSRTTAYNNAVTEASNAARSAATSADATAKATFDSTPGAAHRLQIVQMYTLLFNRGPDIAVLNTWAAQMQSGSSAAQIATAMLATADGAAAYPSTLTTAQFVDKIYQTSLGRAATTAEKQPANTNRAQIVVNTVSTVSAYAGTDAVSIGTLHVFNDKVMTALAGLSSAAAVHAAGAASADDILDKHIPDLVIKSGSFVGTGATSQPASVTPMVFRTFDRWGNVLTESDPGNAASLTRYEYNVYDQVVKQTDELDKVSRFHYDAAGRHIGVVDARGYTNRKAYDAAGNHVATYQADGGVEYLRRDAFGQVILKRLANGEETEHAYDKLGRLTTTTLGGSQRVETYASVDVGTAAARTRAAGDNPQAADPEQATLKTLVETYEYDELGRRIRVTNAAGEQTRTDYDLRGNIVLTRDAGGRQVTYSYDAVNRRTEERRADGLILKYTYEGDYLKTEERQINGILRATSYWYNHLGQVTAQKGDDYVSGTADQNLSFTYDNSSGLLLKIEDNGRIDGQRQVTQYAYDASGNRIREKTSLVATDTGLQKDVLQDNYVTYDALGRISQVSDSRYKVSYEYDANGNRTRVQSSWLTRDWDSATSTLKSTDKLTSIDQWNVYDAMNRQTIVDGKKNAQGVVEIGWEEDANKKKQAVGQQIAYDSAGRRTMVRQWGQRLVGATEEYMTETGPAQHVVWHAQEDMVTDGYRYDAAGRLVGTVRGGLAIEDIRYDAAGRVVQRGPLWPEQPAHSQVNLGSMLLAAGVNSERQVNAYSAGGELTRQTVFNVGNEAKMHVTNRYSVAGRYEGTDTQANGFTQQHNYFYDSLNPERVTTIEGQRADGSARSTTVQQYDANGHLVGVTGTGTGSQLVQTIENDVHGRVLRKTQGGHITHSLIVNGQVLGSSSDAGAPVTETFRQNFVATNHASLTNGAQSYTVAEGETLQTIARGLWGNADLWYVLAQANGKASVQKGDVITIPAKPNTVYNASDTFKPYDPSEAIGEMNPAVPAPPKKQKWWKKLVMIVIAIVATIFTAGALSVGLNAGFGSIMSAGTSALAGGIGGAGLTAGSVVTASGATVAGLGAGGYAVAGAVGSIASQAFGVASGLQDSFSWKQVALSAIGSVASGAASWAVPGGGLEKAIVRGAIGNTIAQGVGVVTGLQKKFDWKSVAASAVGAGVGHAVGGALGLHEKDFGTRYDFGEQLGRRLVTGLAAGATAAAARGGRVSVQQVAIDAFGNALGSSLAEAVSSGPTATRVEGLTFSETVARNEAARMGNTPLWALPDPSQASSGDSVILAGIDGGSMSDAGPGATTRAVEVAAKNLATMRAMAVQRLEGMDPSSGNGLLWARTSQFIGWGQDNLGMASLMASDPSRFASMARADAMLRKPSLMGFYLDSTPENLLAMGEQALTGAIYNQGSARATSIALNVERLARESLLPRLSGLTGAYENRYAYGDPTIENAVLFPQVAGNIGRLDGFTGFLSAMVPGAGQFTAATQIDKRVGTASEMYSVGLLDRASLTAAIDSLGRARAGLGTDFAASLITMGNPLLKVSGGMLLGEDAFAGRMSSPGSLQRQWMNTAKALMANSGASLGQLAVATTLGRYAAMGGAIDAITVSGFAAETFTIAAARSRGLETFAVQRANGTGFDLLTARIDADGVVRDVMNLDVKNTIGSINSVTAFGAGGKRAGTYQSNINFARAQLIEQARLGNPYALDVEAALAKGNFGLAVVTPAAAQVPQAVINSVLQSTGKTVQKLPWLP